MENNIVLIGMPGSGKSTVGVLLAKRLGLSFADTDLIIQSQQGEVLQATLDAQGYEALRLIEERALLDLQLQRTVIATGGSAVYGAAAMKRLAESGTLVYLKVGIEVLRQRIRDFDTRGIARPPEQSFQALFDERTPLYGRYANVTVDASQPPHAVVSAIEAALGV